MVAEGLRRHERRPMEERDDVARGACRAGRAVSARRDARLRAKRGASCTERTRGGGRAHVRGSAKCAGCHPKEAEAFRGSDHALAMQPATERTVLGDFRDAVLQTSRRDVDLLAARREVPRADRRARRRAGRLRGRVHLRREAAAAVSGSALGRPAPGARPSRGTRGRRPREASAGFTSTRARRSSLRIRCTGRGASRRGTTSARSATRPSSGRTTTRGPTATRPRGARSTSRARRATVPVGLHVAWARGASGWRRGVAGTTAWSSRLERGEAAAG